MTDAIETADAAAIKPIDEVARALGIRASAIRYYEQRGLVVPAARHAGRRWYGADEIRRLAVIRYWQTSALMSLDQIAELLAAPGGTRWSEAIIERIRSLDEQIARMDEARSFLRHVLAHHRDAPPDGCRHYEQQIWNGRASTHTGHVPTPSTSA